LGTVAVQDYRTSLGDFTVSEGHRYPLVPTSCNKS
jgi:hypothetical protein